MDRQRLGNVVGQRQLLPPPAAPGQGAPRRQARRPRAASRVSLDEAGILKAMIGFGLVAALLIGQIALRFETLDFKVQHRKLQDRTRALRQEISALETRGQAMTSPSRVREAAQSTMKLRDSQPSDHFVARIPSRLIARYAPKPGASMDAGASGSHKVATDDGAGSMIASVLDLATGKATAATTSQGTASRPAAEYVVAW